MQNDVKKRIFLKKNLSFMKVFNFLTNNSMFNKNVLFFYSFLRVKKKNYFFKTMIKSYCIITGRARGIYRLFRLSRLFVKESLGKNFLAQSRKALW